jgi:hypothetical protein
MHSLSNSLKDLVLLGSVVCLPCLIGCDHRHQKLADTLAWMDNTFNPHKEMDSAGHGRAGRYSSSGAREPEYADAGSAQTFTYDGCDLVLRDIADPAARVSQSMKMDLSYAFNLRDMDPKSVSVEPLTHFTGSRCAGLKPEDIERAGGCDHATVMFTTRTGASLVSRTIETTFPQLEGKDHFSVIKNKTDHVTFLVNDVEYAKRFAKALSQAVELCGGTSPF